MIEAVIFDIDGTLVDSNELHAQCWLQAFAHFGIGLRLEDVRPQIGKGSDQLLPALLPRELVESLGEELTAFRSELWQREFFHLVKPFPRVRELFQLLEREGRRIALASSAKGEELETYKRIANIQDLVDEQTSSDDAEKSKPHPDIFEAALERLGVAADHAIAIGDTPWDAIACTRTHLRAIGVLSGGWSAGALKEAGVIETYDSVAALLDHYETSALAERPIAA